MAKKSFFVSPRRKTFFWESIPRRYRAKYIGNYFFVKDLKIWRKKFDKKS